MKKECDKIIAENAFIYSVYGGSFRCYKGFIIATESFFTGKSKKHARFRNTKTGLWCSEKAGEIFNGVVWFPEKDDEKAKELLIKDLNKKVEILNKKIENLNDLIMILKDGE